MEQNRGKQTTGMRGRPRSWRRRSMTPTPDLGSPASDGHHGGRADCFRVRSYCALCSSLARLDRPLVIGEHWLSSAGYGGSPMWVAGYSSERADWSNKPLKRALRWCGKVGLCARAIFMRLARTPNLFCDMTRDETFGGRIRHLVGHMQVWRRKTEHYGPRTYPRHAAFGVV